MKNKLIITNCIVFFFLCAVSVLTAQQKKQIHRVNYYYYASDNLENDSDVLQKMLTKDIAIVNNIYDKTGILHEFEIQKFIPIPEGISYEDYFFDNKSLYKNIFNIYLDGEKTFLNDPKFYNERNFIFIPRYDIHIPSILMHELVHRIMYKEKQNIHVGVDHEVGTCIPTIGQHCNNLMSKDYFTPFNFLVTETQLNWINNGQYDMNFQKPCEYVIPKNNHGFTSTTLRDTLTCFPRLDLIEEEEVSNAIPALFGRGMPVSHREKNIIEFCFNELIDAPYIQEKLPRRKLGAIINWPQKSDFVDKAVYEKEELRNAAQHLTQLYNYYYDSSELYKNLRKREANILVEGAEKFMKDNEKISPEYVLNIQRTSDSLRSKGRKTGITSVLTFSHPELGLVQRGEKLDLKYCEHFKDSIWEYKLFQKGEGEYKYVYANEEKKEVIENLGPNVCVKYDKNNMIIEIFKCK